MPWPSYPEALGQMANSDLKQIISLSDLIRDCYFNVITKQRGLFEL